MITVFLCEDSLDGILTGVYDAWDSGLGHENVRLDLEEGYSMELFCSCRTVRTDLVKAEKVLRTVARRMGREAEEAVCFASACPEREKADAVYRLIVRGLSMTDGHRAVHSVARRMGREAEEAVCFASACPEREKADAVYRLIVRGLSMTDGHRAVHCLQDPSVSLVMKLRQKAWHEAHRMMGFLRFEELENQVLYAQIEPAYDVLSLIAPHFADRFLRENWIIHDKKRAQAAFEELENQVLYAQIEPAYDVLSLIAPHFADRFLRENWIIHDKKRAQAAVHRAGGGFFLADASFLTQAYLERHPQERGFQMMWKAFCESTAIEERRNPACQQKLLPLRFRHCMTEFQV